MGAAATHSEGDTMKGLRIGSRLRWKLRHGLMHELHGGMQARLHYPLWTMLSLTIRRSP